MMRLQQGRPGLTKFLRRNVKAFGARYVAM